MFGAESRGTSYLLRNAVYKLSLATSIYFLWGERNFRIFQGIARNEAAVSSAIFADDRAKLSTWSSVKFTSGNRKICDDWLLDSRIFSVNN